MRFLYNIEEREGMEYVVLKVIENGLEGKGCVVPGRRRGENYKVIMGVIGEYRKEVEKASIQVLRSLTDLGLDILGVFRNYPGDEMKEMMGVLKGLFKKYGGSKLVRTCGLFS